MLQRLSVFLLCMAVLAAGALAASCTPGERQCDPADSGVVLQCSVSGEWVTLSCSVGKTCQNGNCASAPACAPGAKKCDPADNTLILQCNAAGTEWIALSCAGGKMCQSGSCVDGPLCAPGQKRCDPADKTLLQQCNAAGTQWISLSCPGGKVCQSGSCVDGPACAPGARRCDPADGTVALQCNAAGTQWVSIQCPSGQVCSGGSCASAPANNAGSGGSGSGGSSSQYTGASRCPEWTPEVKDSEQTAVETGSGGLKRSCTKTVYSRYCVENGRINSRWTDRRTATQCTPWEDPVPCEYRAGSTTKNVERIASNCRDCTVTRMVWHCPGNGTSDESKAYDRKGCDAWTLCPGVQPPAAPAAARNITAPPPRQDGLGDLMEKGWVGVVAALLLAGVVIGIAFLWINRRQKEE